MRRYLRSPELITEFMDVGTKISTRCAMVYLDGVANETVVNRVREKIAAIGEAHVLNCGSLAQLLEPRPFLIFPQILQTERPDRTVAALTGGQIALLMDNAPYALILPVTLFDLIHASDDSFMRWQYGTFLRIIRLLGILVALYLPAMYIAVSTNHSHMIPLKLLTSIAETRVDVPFFRAGGSAVYGVRVLFDQRGGHAHPFANRFRSRHCGRADPGAGRRIGFPHQPHFDHHRGAHRPGETTWCPITPWAWASKFCACCSSPPPPLWGCMASSSPLLCYLAGWARWDCFGIPFLAPVAPWRPHNPDIIARLPIWLQRRLNFYAEGGSWLKKEQK